MKIVRAVFGLALLCATAAYALVRDTNSEYEAFLNSLYASGTLSERLGRPIKWLHVDFEDGFFDDFEALNVFSDLEPPWQTNVLPENDTIVVALPNWAAIDDLEGADHIPIDKEYIRQIGQSAPMAFQRFRFDGPDGAYQDSYGVIFLDMEQLARFPKPCLSLLVYEVVRMTGTERDFPKVLESARLRSCVSQSR